MRATFYVIGRGGARVTRVEWSGGWYEGTLTMDAVGDEGAHRQVLGIVAARPDLRRVRFQSAGPAFTVAGWRGLEGNYGALRIAVEAIGARVGALTVE